MAKVQHRGFAWYIQGNKLPNPVGPATLWAAFTIKLFLENPLGRYGWTETYYYSPTASPGMFTEVINAMVTLGKARVPLLGSPLVLSKVIAEQWTDENGSPVPYRNSFQEGPGAFSGITYADNKLTAPEYAAALCRVENQFVSRRSLYLRGLPSDLVTGESFTPNAAWVGAFNNTFKAALTQTPSLGANHFYIRSKLYPKPGLAPANLPTNITNPNDPRTQVYGLTPILDVTFEELVKRNTGRRWDTPRGRRKARV